jgi:diadenosine tetraphosphate (Ap4A) HIT family hydrolase
VTDGHVLIFPMRSTARSLSDLSELEMLELFVCAKEVATKFEEVFKVKNFMILVLEGKNSHSKFDTVCLQVLPQEDRQQMSVDQTSDEIQNCFTESIKIERKPEEMAAEAQSYASLFA